MPSKTTWKRLALAVVAILVLIVIFQNTEQTSFAFFAWEIAMPRFLLLFVVLAIGAGLGILGNRYLFKK